MGASEDVERKKMLSDTKTSNSPTKNRLSLSGKKLAFLSIIINQCQHMTANDKPPVASLLR